MARIESEIYLQVPFTDSFGTRLVYIYTYEYFLHIVPTVDDIFKENFIVTAIE